MTPPLVSLSPKVKLGNKEDKPKCEILDCEGTYELQRHISFVDCPGHDILMATMLNGAAVMDAALLLIGNYLFLFIINYLLISC